MAATPVAVDEKILRKSLSANIARLREGRGLSQAELASAVEVSRVQINRIENGHTTPNADLLYSIADVLGVSTDALRQVSA